MKLQIITPQGVCYEGDVERIQFTSADGMMEFRTGHAPMIAEVKEGTIATDTEQLACGNGVVRVENDVITVVCEK